MSGGGGAFFSAAGASFSSTAGASLALEAFFLPPPSFATSSALRAPAGTKGASTVGPKEDTGGRRRELAEHPAKTGTKAEKPPQ